jgi:hypothetical protein
MELEKYKVRAQTDHLTFEFISEGPKGSIPKIVVYQHMYENFYNLAFGDRNTSGEILDDLITTNNGDTDIVLLTVASTLFDFFEHYEGTIVFAQGSTHSRNRLYRRYLTNFLDVIQQNFILFGELEGEIERFKLGKDYTSFYIQKKY